jgi:DNA invertase Pin-like site-specific DNA recombinase
MLTTIERPAPLAKRKQIRVVTYARVSTKSQKDRGKSLVDQETRFQRWLSKRPDIKLVRPYAEAKSAGTVQQRETFMQMCAELEDLDVQYVVVDSLDRYARDQFDGVGQVKALWQNGVDLWELEFSEDRPFDQHNNDDRDYIYKVFADAEAERRRIKKRQLKRYAEQREGGFTTTNRAGFGMVLLPGPKCERKLAADPDPLRQQICREVDQHFLAGWSTRRLLAWLHATYPKAGAWKSRRGLTDYLRDEPTVLRSKATHKNGTITKRGQAVRTTEGNNYVLVGLRTAADQAKMRELLKGRSYGTDRPSINNHELSGLIACGHCVDVLDRQPEEARMHGRIANGKEALACERHTPNFYVTEERVLALWEEYFDELADPRVTRKVIKLWRDVPLKDANAKQRRVVDSEIAKLRGHLDQLDRDRAAAVRLAGSDKPGVVQEAEAELGKIVERRVETEGEITKHERALSELPNAGNRDPQAALLTDLIESVGWGKSIKTGKDGKFDDAEYRKVLADYRKPFVRALGFPIVHRPDRETKGWRKNKSYKLTWPEMDKLLKEAAK